MIDHEPAFNCWVKHLLKKRDRIIVTVIKWHTRYLKKSHKFCRKLPKTVEQVLALDTENGNTLWANVISEELENFWLAFEILLDGKEDP